MFIPAPTYVQIEPLFYESAIASDEKKFIEAGKVLKVGGMVTGIKVGDIINFRPHGCFELVEHEGIKPFVVRIHDEFYLGKHTKNVAKK